MLRSALNREVQSITAAESLRASTAALLERRAEELTAAHTAPHRSFRRVLLTAVISVLACAMLVSATTIIINRLAYVPGVGFVESGETELFATSTPLDWGITKIESAIRARTVDPESGEVHNRLTVYVTGIKPRGMYIILPDGERFDFAEQHFSDKLFVCEDFPEVNHFTLSVDYKQINVELVEVDQTLYADKEWTTSMGHTFKALPMSDSRTILAVESTPSESFLSDILDGDPLAHAKYEPPYWSELAFYDADGKKYRAAHNGSRDRITRYDGDGDEMYSYSTSSIVYADVGEAVDTEIVKVVAEKFRANLAFTPEVRDGFVQGPIPTFDLPIPEDGETIECDVPLLTIAEQEFRIVSVTRDDERTNGSNLVLELERTVGDSAYDINVRMIGVKAVDSAFRKYYSSYSMYSDTEKDEYELSVGGVKAKEFAEYSKLMDSYEGSTLEMYVADVSFEVNGEWTVDFTQDVESEVTNDETAK